MVGAGAQAEADTATDAASRARGARAPTRALGLAALVTCVLHDLAHLARGEAYDLLWACNVAPLLVGVGALLSASLLVAIGLSWLGFGTPMWCLYMLGGGDILPTTFLIHLGVPLLAVLALRRLGWPRGVWWRATLALMALLLLTRVATPPEANVNLVFRVWTGWEGYFPVFAVYFALLSALATATFAAVDRLAQRLLPA